MTVLPEEATPQSVADVDLVANVATRVRGLMAEQRLNQGDIARVLGVSRSGVSDRLNRTKDFDLRELPRLAELLGESIEYLLGLTDLRLVRHQGLEPRTRWFRASERALTPVETPLATVLQFRPRTVQARILGGRRPIRPATERAS